LEPAGHIGAEGREKLSGDVNAAVATGFERTSVQDVGFGFRQLVDVATRALSPGINDPTTAVHVIGHLSALLCRLADRETGPEHVTDDDGRVRVVLSLPTLPDLLGMAMNQTRHYGAADPVVADRLLELLHELACCDPEGRYHAVLLDHLGRMRSAIDVGEYAAPERQSLLDKVDAQSATVRGGVQK
jgi:uncharacterized membrane protein